MRGVSILVELSIINQNVLQYLDFFELKKKTGFKGLGSRGVGRATSIECSIEIVYGVIGIHGFRGNPYPSGWLPPAESNSFWGSGTS